MCDQRQLNDLMNSHEIKMSGHLHLCHVNRAFNVNSKTTHQTCSTTDNLQDAQRNEMKLTNSSSSCAVCHYLVFLSTSYFGQEEVTNYQESLFIYLTLMYRY